MSEQAYHISLYRRFRPQRFADVVGQEEVVRTLKNAVVAGEVAHAYLFSGERGIGKTTIARLLARAVNCLSQEGGEPCNTCENCTTILANRSLDIMEIDGASNRGIDHIRRLREEVAFAPTDLRTKVYIIDEVHMLTNEAFNALLKTLEEPPRHVVFIFATTEPHKVPRTIVSRCQAFDFRKIPEEKIASHLADIAKEEEVAIAPDALALLARRANGGMRDAIVMLEQAISYAGGEITIEPLLDMLGLVGQEVSEKFLSAIEDGDQKGVLATIDSLVERGKDLEIFLADLVGTVRDRLSQGSETERHDIDLCQGLLDIKQNLFRSLDRRILLEIGLLSLMNASGERPSAPLVSPQAVPQERGLPVEEKEKLPTSVAPEKDEVRSPVDRPVEHEEKGEFSHKWQAMLRAIEQERIAIGAFLSEATPRLSGERVTIAFHPEHSFHKESLEKSANLQYLAGMVHRHLGDQFYIEIRLDDGVVRAPSSRESLREKAKLVCQAFDGTIVKED